MDEVTNNDEQSTEETAPAAEEATTEAPATEEAGE